jgi:hypothetical protein
MVSMVSRMVMNIWFKVLSILVSLFVIAFLFYRTSFEFKPLEVEPQLTSYPYLAKSANERVPEVVSGARIDKFLVFDVINNKFVANVIVWFLFDPNRISLEKVEKFFVEHGEIENLRIENGTTRKHRNLLKMHDGKLFISYNIRVAFFNEMHYQRFPLDDHRLFLVLANKEMSPSDGALVTREPFLKMASIAKNHGDFVLVGRGVRAGYAKSELHRVDTRKNLQYARLVFSFDYQRENMKGILLILIPLFLMFFLGTLALVINLKEHAWPVISLSISSLSSIIMYRFVLNNMSPATSLFMISDKLYSFLLFFAFCILMMDLFFIVITKNNEVFFEHAKLIRSYVLTFVLIVVSVFVYVLTA